MPVLELRTNTKITNKKEVTLKASKLMSELLGKPEAVLPFPAPYPLHPYSFASLRTRVPVAPALIALS